MVNCEAKQAFGINPSLLRVVLSIDHTFPLTSLLERQEGAVLVRCHPISSNPLLSNKKCKCPISSKFSFCEGALERVER